MSIRFRLNALMVSLLSLALVIFLGSMIMSAGPRIHAENESMMRLAEEFVQTAIESLQGTTNPGARLEVLLDGLKNLRHVHIYRAPDNGTKSGPPPEPAPADEGGAPAWLSALGQPEHRLAIPVFVNGQSFGDLVIAPQAADESAEIWDSIVKVSAVGTGLLVATLLLMSLMIAHLLRPIRTVGEALIVLDGGNYDVRVPERGPPEIADICRKLNRLAATLKTTISENRRLTERIIFIQDEERKDLARELHDELGPYLFAIRAGASAIKTEVARLGDKPKIVQGCETMLERIETMQRMNRRVLQKLRPIGLDEFGLKAKLVSLIAMWRESHPDVKVSLHVSEDIPERDETSNLTLYRIVQEGLTNAFRHAAASEIEVAVEPIDESEAGEAAAGSASANGTSAARPIIHVTVADNGRGIAEEARPNYGIAGMRERVWATGGKVIIRTRPSGGTMLEAWVPASAAAAEGTAAPLLGSPDSP